MHLVLTQYLIELQNMELNNFKLIVKKKKIGSDIKYYCSKVLL